MNDNRFIPKYIISNKLLENIKRISIVINELNNRSFSKVVIAKLEKIANEVSSYSSTSIEGNPLPLTDVRRILKNKPENIRDTEREVLNYNNALVELNKLLSNNHITFNTKLILQIHKNITNGLIPKHNCGKIRQEPVFVNNPKLQKTVYLPPDYQEMQLLLEELVNFVNVNINKIDPLIIAGIFHKQFVILHPFIDGNGRTARLTTKVLLANMGINTFNLFSFENYYNKNVSNYFEKVGLIGNYYDIKNKIDFTGWLEYFTDGIIDELLRVSKTLSEENNQQDIILKQHHKKIITFIEKHGYITDSEYAKLTKRSRASRHLDFKKLIQLNIIKMLEQGKKSYYKFNKDK